MIEQAISKDEALALLREHKPVLAERYGVGELALFGSTARDEARPDSDIDVLVSLPGMRGWAGYGEVSEYLEEVFSQHVDLLVDVDMRAELRSSIEADVVYV